MLAFTGEARFNFLGDRMIEDSDERASAMRKASRFVAIWTWSLNSTRIVPTPEELDSCNLLHAAWGRFIVKDFLANAYDDLEEIWQDPWQNFIERVDERLTP